MLKNSVIALVAAAAMAGVAVPTMADTGLPFGSGSEDSRAFAADNILARLHDKGVRANSVEEWGGLVRAYVTLDDGSQVMQFFTADGLEPVSL